MKSQTRVISTVLAACLLFSGFVVIAGGSVGWEPDGRLPIHLGEFCRDAMMNALGVPKEELYQGEAKSVRAEWDFSQQFRTDHCHTDADNGIAYQRLISMACAPIQGMLFPVRAQPATTMRGAD